MKRSAALALLGLFILGMGALGATPQGRRWLKDVAAAQVDDVLDTVTLTQNQRRALEDLKTSVAAEVDAKLAQLHSLIRCVVNPRPRPSRRLLIGLPAMGPISEVHLATPLLRRSGHNGFCAGNGFVPPPRGSVAAEWRSWRAAVPR